MAEKDKGGLKSDSFGEQVLEILMDRPTLPKQAITAIKDCFALLFGPEQYARFVAQRPSLADYVRLGRALFSIYGVSLGEAFASPDSSENAGETPKQTSPSTTESTPETPGAAPETPAS